MRMPVGLDGVLEWRLEMRGLWAFADFDVIGDKVLGPDENAAGIPLPPKVEPFFVLMSLEAKTDDDLVPEPGQAQWR